MLRSARLSPFLPIALTALIALAYALLTAYATTWGPWGFSDTAAYIAAARNLAGGLGLRLPDASGVLHPSLLTPPFYTWILALGAAAGLNPLEWARALNLFLAFLFPAGLGLLVGRAAGRYWFAPALAALLACFPILFSNAASAMSEQLFFCLGFSGLLLLVSEQPLSPRRLILSAALVGLAGLTRYLGAAFILAAFILVWLAGKPLPPRRRWLQTGLYALGAALPLLLWLAWTLFATGTLGARTLGAAPPLLALRWSRFQLHTLEILAAWVPYGARAASVLSAQGKLLLILVLWAAAAAWGWPAASPALRRLFLAALLFSLAYLVVLGAAFLFANIPPDLIPRMVSPLWPAHCLAWAATAGILAQRLERFAPRWVTALPFAGLLLIVLVNAVYFAPQIGELADQGHRDGVGYTSRVWRESPVFERIRTRLADHALISDEPALILLYTGRGAYPWEEWIQGNLRTAADQPLPGQGEGRLHDLMRSGAALVLFPPRVEEEFNQEDVPALLGRWTAGLDALYRAPEAEILLAP